MPERVSAISAALDRAGLEHTIGGAIALGFYAAPRPTTDIDVNVFVAPESWSEVREALAPLGVDVDVEESAPVRDGQVRLDWAGTTVDLFFSDDPLHEAMPAAARRVPFAGTTIPIISPEHLIVRKATLDRPKDWADIGQILVATEPLDVAEMTGWLERLIGPDDPRLDKLRDLLRRRSIPR